MKDTTEEFFPNQFFGMGVIYLKSKTIIRDQYLPMSKEMWILARSLKPEKFRTSYLKYSDNLKKEFLRERAEGEKLIHESITFQIEEPDFLLEISTSPGFIGFVSGGEGVRHRALEKSLGDKYSESLIYKDNS